MSRSLALPDSALPDSADATLALLTRGSYVAERSLATVLYLST